MSLVAGLIGALILYGSAQAAELTVVEEGKWSIVGADHTCSMQATFADHTVMRVIAAATTSELSFVFMNPKWKSVASGRPVQVQVAFPGHSTWGFDALGLEPVEAGHGFGFQQDPQKATFVAEFALASKLNLLRNGLPVTSLSLQDSKEALNSLFECQRRLRSGPGFDPFNDSLPSRA